MEGAPVPARGRPLGVGGVIRAGFNLYGRCWPQLLVAVAVIVVPAQILVWVIVRATVGSGARVINGNISVQNGSFAGAEVTIIGLTVISAILAMGTACRMLMEAYVGQSISFGESFRYVGRHLIPLIGLAIVAGIAILIGYVFFVIPGVFLTVAWCVAVPALIFERAGVTLALQRSFALVRGHWWETFLALLPTVVIVIAVSYAVGSILGGSSSSSNVSTILALGAVGRVLGTLISYPLIAAITAVIYVNLRVQKENLDPQTLTQEVGR